MIPLSFTINSGQFSEVQKQKSQLQLLNLIILKIKKKPCNVLNNFKDANSIFAKLIKFFSKISVKYQLENTR